MIKRTLEISREPAHLAVSHCQLLLKREGAVVATIPCEDLGVVVVDHPQTTYTHSALTSLMACDAVVVVCGPDHLPCGVLLPLSDHTQVVWRLNSQIATTQPTRKRIWQQLVRAKIHAQADNLVEGSPVEKRLREFAARVRSGDPQNLEAQAAKAYWSVWLMYASPLLGLADFTRSPDLPGVNALLNYGYAIMRAAIARAIVAAGLHPALGVFHSNRSNAFCLADDMLEPLRPVIDSRVRDLAFEGHTELTQTVKAELLNLLTQETQLGETSGPLLVVLHRYVRSLVNCMEGTSTLLEIPRPCNSAATASCGSS